MFPLFAEVRQFFFFLQSFGFIIVNMSIYMSQQIAFKALMSVNGNDDVTDAHTNNLDDLCNCMIKSFCYSQEKTR